MYISSIHSNLSSLQFTPQYNNQVYLFYTLQALDIITTYRGLKKSDTVKELNPFLGDRPSLSQIILFKSAVFYTIDPRELDSEILKELNHISLFVVLNNHTVFNSVN